MISKMADKRPTPKSLPRPREQNRKMDIPEINNLQTNSNQNSIPNHSFKSPSKHKKSEIIPISINSENLREYKQIESKIQENKNQTQGLSFEPLILECKKLIVLMRNICARKGILLLEEIENVDEDGLGVISTNKLGFLLETLVGLNGKQIKTLLGFFDSFKFGYVNVKDFCVCLRDESLLKEVALKIGNKMEKIKMMNKYLPQNIL